MNTTENKEKRISNKNIFFIGLGIFLAIIIAGGGYQYSKIKQRETLMQKIGYSIINDGGFVKNFKYRFPNSLRNTLYTKLLRNTPIPYSISRFVISNDIIFTAVEFKNKSYTSDILSTELNYFDLEDVVFINAGITDQNSSFLAKHSNIKRINLSQNKITDKTLLHFQQLKFLEDLDLSNTNISDEGIIQLAKKGVFKNLHSINLSHTNVSDKIVEYLVPLEMLVIVKLNLTNITDVGIEEFSKNDLIHTLELEGNEITDKSVDTIISMHNLMNPSLYNTKISGEGFKKLSKERYPWMNETTP